MTTTTAAVKLNPRTREQRINEAVRKATDVDGTIDDALTLLGLVGSASVAELAGGDGPGAAFDALARAQTLCLIAGVLLRRFDPLVRCAPPAALVEVVRDARVSCGAAHLGCHNTVLPWSYDDVYCSPACEVADDRTRP